MSNTLRDYDMTPADQEQLLASQDHRCAICRRPFNAGRRPCRDHEHATGLLRGLLCDRCNYDLLGTYHDDAQLFARAAEYIRHPPALDVFTPPKRHRNAPPIRENDSDV